MNIYIGEKNCNLSFELHLDRVEARDIVKRIQHELEHSNGDQITIRYTDGDSHGIPTEDEINSEDLLRKTARDIYDEFLVSTKAPRMELNVTDFLEPYITYCAGDISRLVDFIQKVQRCIVSITQDWPRVSTMSWDIKSPPSLGGAMEVWFIFYVEQKGEDANGTQDETERSCHVV